MMTTDFESVTDPSWLHDLAAKSLDDVREMRSEAQTLENTASFVRRFVQGRLDLVAAAKRGETVATPEAITHIISQDDGNRTGDPTTPRPPLGLGPDLLPAHLLEQLDAIISAEELLATETLPAGKLDEAFESLLAFEQQTSRERRKLHEIIDELQAEIVRRYRSGEADVDGLLNQG